MRILSLSTHGIPCGIATYNAGLKSAVEDLGHTYDVEPVTRELREASDVRAFAPFLKRFQQYDAAVVQHEFGLYGATPNASRTIFSELLSDVRASRKPALVFFHSNLLPTRRPRPFSFTSTAARERRSTKRLVRSINRCERLKVVVHGRASHEVFSSYGVNADRLFRIYHPMMMEQNGVSRVRRNDDEIRLGVFGFISEYKGYETILQAMTQLPDRFKLVIAGGRHPEAANDLTLNKIYGFLATGSWPNPRLPPIPPLSADAIQALRGRVSVTGYLQSEEINSTLADVDIVLAPYTDNGPTGSGALSVSLSLGKPIIASSTPAFLEIQRMANCIKLVPIKAPFELAHAIKGLAENQAEMDRLSNAARLFAKENSFTALASQCVDLLRGMD